MNTLDKLIDMKKRNDRNREVTLEYLTDIENILSPFFLDFYNGKNDFPAEPQSICIKTWDKEKRKYICKGDLFFIYNPIKKPKGFSIVFMNDLEHVSSLKSEDFWIKVKEITEWLEKGLILFLEKNMKSKDQRVERLQKFIEKLK